VCACMGFFFFFHIPDKMGSASVGSFGTPMKCLFFTITASLFEYRTLIGYILTARF
jgi:hypothetical protein